MKIGPLGSIEILRWLSNGGLDSRRLRWVKHVSVAVIGVVAGVLSAGCSGSDYSHAGEASAAALNTRSQVCPPDSTQVGPTCVDFFEESVWKIPSDRTDLIAKVQAGEATVKDLTDGGATQATCNFQDNDNPLKSFPTNGNWIDPLYAVSLEGTTPANCVTWLQAEQMCALSGKRLLSNQEWQRAAAGPTEGPPCIVSAQVSTTGTDACLSNWYVNDLGNGWEWVAEWTDLATRIPPNSDCANWYDPLWGVSCVGGPGTYGVKDHPSYPGARHRGGAAYKSVRPRIFDISDGDITTNRGYPSWPGNIAFRCARPLPTK